MDTSLPETSSGRAPGPPVRVAREVSTRIYRQRRDDESLTLVERRSELPVMSIRTAALRRRTEAPVQHRAPRRWECDETGRGGPSNAARTCQRPNSRASCYPRGYERAHRAGV